MTGQQGGGLGNRWARAVRKYFPERQLILRTDGRITYLKISHRLQMMCCVVTAVAVGWGMFTSFRYFVTAEILRGKDAQIVSARMVYRNLLSEVSDYQTRFSLLTKELEKNHAMMLDLVETNATLHLNLRSTESRLQSSHSEQTEILAAKSALRDRLALIENELWRLNTRNFELRSNLNVVTTDLESAVSQRNQAQATNAKLSRQVTRLAGEIDRLHQTEMEIVQRLTERTQEGIAFMEGIFAQAGLKPEEFIAQTEGTSEAEEAIAEAQADKLAETETAGGKEADPIRVAALGTGVEMAITAQGGPFIDALALPGSGDRLKASLGSLEEQLGRWDDLRQLMRAAPLPPPLDHFTISSDFGKRRDPINQRWSMHYGIDLRAPTSSPIYATAPGVVTFAGSKNTYGYLIEIDHGMGFKTRYAHLKKILVKKGQEVDYREKIGLLGTSGRSTGPHLHYEIVQNGKPINPMRFFKAAKYVYKR